MSAAPDFDLWEETLEKAVRLAADLYHGKDYKKPVALGKLEQKLAQLDQDYVQARVIEKNFCHGFEDDVREALELTPLFRELLRSVPSFGEIAKRSGRVMLVWRLKTRRKAGRLIEGSALVAPKREREIYIEQPWWVVELCLCNWLLERHVEGSPRRILDHELSSLDYSGDKPAIRPPDISEYSGTLERHGMRRNDIGQAMVANALRRRKDTGAIAREAGLSAFGQSDLFGGEYRPVKRYGDNDDDDESIYP